MQFRRHRKWPFLQIRILKLARLIKLLRVFRVSRFMESLETSAAVNYSYLQLAQHIATVLLATHWVACALVLFLKVEVCFDWL